MAEDRLTQIWGAFAKSTTRYLTDSTIDNIPRPDFKDPDHRQGGLLYQGEQPGAALPDMAFAGLEMPQEGLPGQIGEPARAAMSALRERLSAQGSQGKQGLPGKQEPQGRMRRQSSGPVASYRADAADRAASPGRRAGRETIIETQGNVSAAGGSSCDDRPANRLVEDLKATAMLTTRRETNYLSYAMAQNLLTPEKKKRRGFLSFFRKKDL